MKILLFVIFLLTSFCKFAFSDEQQIIAMGDKEYGQYLGAECASCHHQAGVSKGIPATMIAWARLDKTKILKRSYLSVITPANKPKITAGKYANIAINPVYKDE